MSTNVAVAGHDRVEWGMPIRVILSACLILFPLLWMIFGGTSFHPSPEGKTAADQVASVGASSDDWRAAHWVLTAASLFGVGAVLALQTFVRTTRFRGIGFGFAVLGVAAAGMLAGVVLMEVELVAPVAGACARTPECISGANAPYLKELADAGWNYVPPLGWAGGAVIGSIMVLAILGGIARVFRAWEAGFLVAACIGVYATDPGLHGAAIYPLTFMLVVFTTIAYRLVRGAQPSWTSA